MTLFVDHLPCRRSLPTPPRRQFARGVPRIVGAVLFAVAFGGAAALCNAAPPSLAESALVRKLDARTTLSWDGQELAAALQRLAAIQELPLWIDRRVDPNAIVKLSLNNATVREVLDGLAAGDEQQWGWTALRTVVYFGPRQAAHELATLSERSRQAIARAPADVRRRWLTPTPWEYPRLSEPRTLLSETAAAAGAELRGDVDLPHDLWPARSLPAAPIDRLVLLLAGFNDTMDVTPDGSQLRVVPIKRPVQFTAAYPATEPLKSAAAKLATVDPTIRVRTQGRRLSVAARWEDHETLKRVLNPAGSSGEEPPRRGGAEAKPQPGVEAQRFTLRIANKPLGAVLAQLAGQLQLTVEWDPAVTAVTPPYADALVSCDVREADLDGLLKALLDSAGLSFTRTGQAVKIHAAR